MSDARNRELERDASDPAAAIALLVERMRSGELTPERLQLAAVCGDPAARTVLGDDAPAELDWVSPLASLSAFGQPVWRRACAAAIRAAWSEREAWRTDLEVWLELYCTDPEAARSAPLEPLDPTLDAALDDALACVRLPFPPRNGAAVFRDQTREACRDAALLLSATHADVQVFEGPGGWGLDLMACGSRKIMVVKELRRALGVGLREAVDLANEAEQGSYSSTLRHCERASDPATLEAAVREDLRTWALGPERVS